MNEYSLKPNVNPMNKNFLICLKFELKNLALLKEKDFILVL